MATRVYVASPESTLQMRRNQIFPFSFRAEAVKQTRYDWSVIRLHRQYWKLTGGTVGIRWRAERD